ncbi:MAG: glycosyltransferase family 39 protein [Chitinophagaceae bacterium]|nr:glycosyltransferase family 39 protein [Chitinophagaceae bacterium]
MGTGIRRIIYSRSTFLLLVLVLIRLPFFFRDYVDRDESTFILMGQSVADGYLPYDFLWDLKPPLLFYLFGLIEFIFPDSLVAIRVFGTLVIFGSALLLIAIARLAELKNGFLVAFVYVLLSSLFGSVQGVMSEHIAVFFMLAALYFFLKRKSVPTLFLSGLFLGCALLCKMNYAYAIPLLLALYAVLYGKELPLRKIVKHMLAMVGGILLSIFLVAIPFLASNRFELFVDSVFLAPYEYGQALHLSIGQKIQKTWWIIVVGLIVSFLSIRRMAPEQREAAWAFVIVVMATIYTFFSSATVNGHYLLQVYPFLALLLLGIVTGRDYRPRMAWIIIVVILVSGEAMLEYYRLGKHVVATGKFYNGSSLIAIEEINKKGLENEAVFFADYHIGYWFIDRYPLTKSTTHPSSLARPFLFKYFGNLKTSSMEELKYLFEEVRPRVVVSKNRHLSFFEEGSSENDYFRHVKGRYYQPVFEDSVKRIYIWERNVVNPN